MLSAAILGLATFAFGVGPVGFGSDTVGKADTLFDLLGRADEIHVDDDASASDDENAEPTCGLLNVASLQLSILSEPWLDLPEAEIEVASHVDSHGVVITYEQIAKRLDRPADYEAYRYPVARFLGWPRVVSGYDLDRPSESQRRGSMKATGHGGVDLAQFMGAPINMVPLSHQVGPAEVIYVGPLFGNTVVTRHVVREAGGNRDYVLLFGHLSEPAPNLRRGYLIRSGDLVGKVGDSDSPNLVHLHLEARRVKDGVDARKLGPDGILGSTVVTDPRNVLPLAVGQASASCRSRGRDALYMLGDRPRLTWMTVPRPFEAR